MTIKLGPYPFEQGSLRFFPHAEGRMLRFFSDTSGAVRYQCEFTVKDYLSNLRLAYRAGQNRTYLATFEQDDNTRKRESILTRSPSACPSPWPRPGPWASTRPASTRVATPPSPTVVVYQDLSGLWHYVRTPAELAQLAAQPPRTGLQALINGS